MEASAAAPRSTVVQVARVFAAALVVAFCAWAASFFVPGVVTGSAETYSVERAFDAMFTLCTVEARGVRTCDIVTSDNSASDVYDVHREGRCWTAVRVRDGGSEPKPPERVKGCIRLADNIRLFERVMFLSPPIHDFPRDGLLREPAE